MEDLSMEDLAREIGPSYAATPGISLYPFRFPCLSPFD
jgi:hypothetical protein